MKLILKNISSFFIKEKIFSLTVLIFAIVSVINPFFLSAYNLSNLSMQIAIYGIVSLGMTFAIIGGNFDLSVGSIVSLTGVIAAALLSQVGLFLAMVAAISSGILIGAINGFFIARQKLSAFIVTFSSMVIIKGVALSLSDGRPIISNNAVFNNLGTIYFFGIPLLFFIFVFFLLLSHYILTNTRFGRNVFAVGGNYEVAKSTGIRVTFYRWFIFVITGFLSAIVGILITIRLNSGSPIQGDGMELTAIASVVIGGTHLSGGKGSVFRTLLGVFVMVLLTNAFDMIGIQPYVQKVIKGAIILTVVAADSYEKRKMVI